MSRSGTILVIEDNVGTADSLRQVLEDEGHAVIAAATGGEGLALAAKRNCDVVLTDLKLPDLSGLDIVKRLRTVQAALPIILMTAHGTTDIAIEATRHGAFDYLLKPFEMPAMLHAIERALAASRLVSQPVEIGNVVAGRDAIIGRSRAMQEIYKEIGRVAATTLTVLIRGETGTGKELIARAIYQHSDRFEKPFIAVNCAAIPETLLESELFGHEKGAFTGADARRIGRFEQADGGTIFLDEIGDMRPNTQAKLLRVLQEKTIQRLGGRDSLRIDVRVLARPPIATWRSATPRKASFAKIFSSGSTLSSFRGFRRFASGQRTSRIPRNISSPATVPSSGLRSSSIHSEALRFLQQQPWRGNVRELENAVRKALLMARGYPIGFEEASRACAGLPASGLPGESLASYVSELLASASRDEVANAHAALIDAAERELFSQAIQLAQGNQAKAARWLGISRFTMREKLNRFGPPSRPKRRTR